MNVDNIRQIARDILDHKNDFDMSTGFHSCGTPACIAGFCAAAMGMDHDNFYRSIQPNLLINKFFNIHINLIKQQSLYAPDNEYANWNARHGQTGFVTPEHAASVLYYLADTGEIDWSVKGYFPVEIKAEEAVLVEVRNEVQQSERF